MRSLYPLGQVRVEIQISPTCLCARWGLMSFMSMRVCSPPPPPCRLGPDELEMGLGIHGEPGAYREKIRWVELGLVGGWVGG